MSHAKMTPLDRLKEARVAHERAAERCPHWDFAGLQSADHPCCADLAEAGRKLYEARRTYNRSQMQ
jgi:hypothetical protein